jgi:hypothetical protein
MLRDRLRVIQVLTAAAVERGSEVAAVELEPEWERIGGRAGREFDQPHLIGAVARQRTVFEPSVSSGISARLT